VGAARLGLGRAVRALVGLAGGAPPGGAGPDRILPLAVVGLAAAMAAADRRALVKSAAPGYAPVPVLRRGPGLEMLRRACNRVGQTLGRSRERAGGGGDATDHQHGHGDRGNGELGPER
jgi:hypothetical protein